MPASPSRSSTDGPRPSRRRPARALRPDDDGVTEAMGAILSFAIITVVFILSMLAFQRAQLRTEDRIIALRADSAAARVSSLVVHAASFAEANGGEVLARYVVDLPTDLEGRSYQVALVEPGGTESARIEVRVPSRSITAEAPLFSIEASDVAVCATTVQGGEVVVRYGPSPSDPSTTCVFLEAAA